YAARALVALGGNRIMPKEKEPKLGKPGEEALSWFPASATLAGFLDGRHAKEGTADHAKETRKLLTTFVKRQQDWDEVFNVAEMIGNVRIDRLAFAFTEDAKEREKGRLYMRIAGKANQKWLVEGIKKLSRGERIAWSETKDAKGVPITIMETQFGGPAIAFVGDGDC